MEDRYTIDDYTVISNTIDNEFLGKFKSIEYVSIFLKALIETRPEKTNLLIVVSGTDPFYGKIYCRFKLAYDEINHKYILIDEENGKEIEL